MKNFADNNSKKPKNNRDKCSWRTIHSSWKKSDL